MSIGKIMTSYVSPKLEVRNSPIEGKGVFAVEKIYKGEVVVDCTGALGKLMPCQEAEPDGRPYEDYDLQIDNDFVLVKTSKDELDDGDFINHSCRPNCGIGERFQFISMRDIEPGEEITYDYAMSDSYECGAMECMCREEVCRRFLKGSDWKIRELQERYRGFFSPYLERKIESQRSKWMVPVSLAKNVVTRMKPAIPNPIPLFLFENDK